MSERKDYYREYSIKHPEKRFLISKKDLDLINLTFIKKARENGEIIGYMNGDEQLQHSTILAKAKLQTGKDYGNFDVFQADMRKLVRTFLKSKKGELA